MLVGAITAWLVCRHKKNKQEEMLTKRAANYEVKMIAANDSQRDLQYKLRQVEAEKETLAALLEIEKDQLKRANKRYKLLNNKYQALVKSMAEKTKN